MSNVNWEDLDAKPYRWWYKLNPVDDTFEATGFVLTNHLVMYVTKEDGPDNPACRVAETMPSGSYCFDDEEDYHKAIEKVRRRQKLITTSKDVHEMVVIFIEDNDQEGLWKFIKRMKETEHFKKWMHDA